MKRILLIFLFSVLVPISCVDEQDEWRALSNGKRLLYATLEIWPINRSADEIRSRYENCALPIINPELVYPDSDKMLSRSSFSSFYPYRVLVLNFYNNLNVSTFIMITDSSNSLAEEAVSTIEAKLGAYSYSYHDRYNGAHGAVYDSVDIFRWETQRLQIELHKRNKISDFWIEIRTNKYEAAIDSIYKTYRVATEPKTVLMPTLTFPDSLKVCCQGVHSFEVRIDTLGNVSEVKLSIGQMRILNYLNQQDYFGQLKFEPAKNSYGERIQSRVLIPMLIKNDM